MGSFNLLSRAFSGQEFMDLQTLQESQANNLVNAIPLLGVEFWFKLGILGIVLRAGLRHNN